MTIIIIIITVIIVCASWHVSGYVYVIAYVWRSEDNFEISDSLLLPLHKFLISYWGHQACMTTTSPAKPPRPYWKNPDILIHMQCVLQKHSWKMTSWKVMFFIPEGTFMWEYCVSTSRRQWQEILLLCAYYNKIKVFYYAW